jgi:flagella basal body P-ring formation protein FlgA
MRSTVITFLALSIALVSGGILSGCQQRQDQSAAPKGELAYVLHDIKKGQAITSKDIETKQVNLATIPPDAATRKEIAGHKASVDLSSGMILSIRDIGIAPSEKVLKRLLVDKTASVRTPAQTVIAAKNLKAGDKLADSDCQKAELELEQMPQDALFETSQAVGRTCKFDIKAGEILMQHELK